MKEKFTYETVNNASESLFKDKGSKFYGYIFPLKSEDEVYIFLEKIKSEHPKARHYCYAYRFGIKEILERANDDGEPNGSAGLPILNQLKSFETTNILAIVVRYFGGIKLGVSGLINAYKTATQLALENNDIVKINITSQFKIITAYEHANYVYQLIAQHDAIISEQTIEIKSQFIIDVPLKNKNLFLSAAKKNRNLEIQLIVV